MDVPEPILSSNRILSPFALVKTADRRFLAVISTGRTSFVWGMAQGGAEESEEVLAPPNDEKEKEGEEKDGLEATCPRGTI